MPTISMGPARPLRVATRTRRGSAVKICRLEITDPLGPQSARSPSSLGWVAAESPISAGASVKRGEGTA